MQVADGITQRGSNLVTLILSLLLLSTCWGKRYNSFWASFDSSIPEKQDQQPQLHNPRQRKLQFLNNISASGNLLLGQVLHKDARTIPTPLLDISIDGSDIPFPIPIKKGWESLCSITVPGYLGTFVQPFLRRSASLAMLSEESKALESQGESAITAAMSIKFGDHTDLRRPMEMFSGNKAAVQNGAVQPTNSHIAEYWGLVEQRQGIPCIVQPQKCGGPSQSSNGTAGTAIARQLKENPRFVPQNQTIVGAEVQTTGNSAALDTSPQESRKLGFLVRNGTGICRPLIQAPLVPLSILYKPAIILKISLAASYQVDFINGTVPTVRATSPPISCHCL